MVCFEPIVLLRIVPIVLLRFGKYILKHNVEAHIVNFFHKIFVQRLVLKYLIFIDVNHRKIDWFKHCSHHSASIFLWSKINVQSIRYHHMTIQKQPMDNSEHQWFNKKFNCPVLTYGEALLARCGRKLVLINYLVWERYF